MAQVKFFKGFILIGLIALVWACSGSDTPQTPQPGTDDGAKNRQALLTNLADQIIIPGYANFRSKFDAMAAKSAAFEAKPDAANLVAFRTAWQEAYIEWQKVEVFDVGPASKKAIRNFYNIYPTNVAGIEANIDNTSANLEISASYDKQGFPALDYLINGTGKTDAEIVTYYTGTNGPKRLAYVKRIVTHMQDLITQVQADWNGTYRTDFTTKTGTDIGSPMGELVNGFVLHYERYIRSGKVGIPSGAMMNGIVAPEKVEAFYKKDLSKILLQTAHQAAVDFFNGKSTKTGQAGPSFKTYLDALGAKESASGKTLSELINTEFATSKTKVDGLNANLYQEIQTNNQAMKDVFTELQKVVRMLKVDMTSAMSITITYTDNDGD